MVDSSVRVVRVSCPIVRERCEAECNAGLLARVARKLLAQVNAQRAKMGIKLLAATKAKVRLTGESSEYDWEMLECKLSRLIIKLRYELGLPF